MPSSFGKDMCVPGNEDGRNPVEEPRNYFHSTDMHGPVHESSGPAEEPRNYLHGKDMHVPVYDIEGRRLPAEDPKKYLQSKDICLPLRVHPEPCHEAAGRSGATGVLSEQKALSTEEEEL